MIEDSSTNFGQMQALVNEELERPGCKEGEFVLHDKRQMAHRLGDLVVKIERYGGGTFDDELKFIQALLEGKSLVEAVISVGSSGLELVSHVIGNTYSNLSYVTPEGNTLREIMANAVEKSDHAKGPGVKEKALQRVASIAADLEALGVELEATS